MELTGRLCLFAPFASKFNLKPLIFRGDLLVSGRVNDLKHTLVFLELVMIRYQFSMFKVEILLRHKRAYDKLVNLSIHGAASAFPFIGTFDDFWSLRSVLMGCDVTEVDDLIQSPLIPRKAIFLTYKLHLYRVLKGWVSKGRGVTGEPWGFLGKIGGP